MIGSAVHFEFPAQDAERAKGFWSELFGWQFQSWDGPVEYHMTPPGSSPSVAIYPSESGERGPVVYFDAGDIDATVARVRELGGEAENKQPIPGVGWFARCRDSEGNHFSLFQSDESVQAPGQA